MPGFYHPAWLLGLLILPILWYLRHVVTARKKAAAMEFSGVSFLKSVLADRQGSRRVRNLFLLSLLAIGLILVGLADPHIPLEGTEEGVNVVLVMDVSGSMQATDYSPTRLEAAKSAASILLDHLGANDYAGVVLFESGATTAAYLSPDHGRVKEKLAAVRPREGQTALGDGLALGIDMADSIPNRKKVVILLSDGVSNAGVISPSEAGAFAQERNVQVFTVGLGSDTPTVMGYDWFGNPQYAEVDEATLQGIAQATQGAYYRSVDEQTLSAIYADLNGEIRREPEERSIRDLFFAAAVVVLLVELYLRYGPGRIIQ
ncbi:vWA domain-containing protein [Methanofollis fontis]|uniref:Aerotolerance regulator BatA n=1 Tax=Methanofollis fontis TaxID=2052832 RepID=A0A483CSB1_9EURY|nr:VWA domain-containing protein [Methanofollis fontis]TAJ45758.1 aerotolerance regulator BatA [Methanofollis fontis]